MKKIFLCFAIILCMFSFTACLRNNLQENTTSKKPTIVTSFYPVYIFTKNITRDIPDVKVMNLASPSVGCLHDYQLTPDNMDILEDAQVLIINGAGMESFTERITKQIPGINIIDSSIGVDTLPNVSKETPQNPHIWLSTTNAIQQVNNIGSKLAEIYPENRDRLLLNTAEYVKKLNLLNTRIEKTAKELKKKDIVTFHEAFPYLAKSMNLNIVTVIEREPGTEPSAGELVKIISQIKSKNKPTIFVEPQYSPKIAETISRETGSKIYTLDPVVTGEDSPDAYINIMDKNLETLKEALR